MTDGLATPAEAQGIDQLPGVRLDEVQLLNWGTFDQTVARFPIGGENSLLTGQVGAGKSTIVDGLTTLFASAGKITFNRAAGAESRERTPASYVLGHYRNTFDIITGTQKPEALRTTKKAYSVLLARFQGVADTDAGMYTAGVIYWFAEAASAPSRLYFTAPRALDIADHLTGHATIREVRGNLRQLGASIDDDFTSYAAKLCRSLGTTRAALDLLVQTISMKAVGNLTDFVREHMLEKTEVADLIGRVLNHYADLVRAHELVRQAREQIELLNPVVEHANRWDRADERIKTNSAALAAVPRMVAEHRINILSRAIARLDEEVPNYERDVERIRLDLERRDREQLELEIAIAAEGGTELREAERIKEAAQKDLETTRRAATDLAEHARKAGVTPPDGAGDHARFVSDLAAAVGELETQRGANQDAITTAHVELRTSRDEVTSLKAQLQTAGTRQSNVPEEDIRVRDRVAIGVGVNPDALPFVAELVRVVPEAAERWEAATEKLTRSFALSVLVSHDQYPAVAEWVDQNNLRGQVNYYPVPPNVSTPRPPEPRTIAACLNVRPEHQFSAWVETELNGRYPHICAEGADEMRTHTRAVTAAGQIKDRTRHRKDDRPGQNTRRNYVLGWDTAARREALAEALTEAESEVNRLEKAYGSAHDAGRDLRERDLAAHVLIERFTDARLTDVANAMKEVEAAEALLADLRSMATDLDALIGRRDKGADMVLALKRRQETVTKRLGGAQNERGGFSQDLNIAKAAREEADQHDLDEAAAEALEEAVAKVGETPETVGQVIAWENHIGRELQDRLRTASSTRERVGRELVTAMNGFATAWEHMVTDLNPSDVESRNEFRALRERLERDDLPRFEFNFKEQLEKNAIHELVGFAKFLEREGRSIQERIATINDALGGIDYHLGTYIRLEPDSTTDPAVREFRNQLQDITTGTLLGGGDDTYTEARFFLVKELLDRFKGREGSTNADKAWTARVTDVRNWFTFAAAERRRPSPDATNSNEDPLVEHYTDSGGKSGGQKEKLAYTVLAAALSYQYGLASGDSNAFRFVMIDEAFGRGSDESTRFGLELFTRLGLQLMVVTPLQKIEAIEPHVKAVGYVKAGDPRSRLLSLTIEELKERRAARRERLLPDLTGPA